MTSTELQMHNALGEEEIMRVKMVIPGQCREATAIKMLKAERDRYKKALGRLTFPEEELGIRRER